MKSPGRPEMEYASAGYRRKGAEKSRPLKDGGTSSVYSPHNKGLISEHHVVMIGRPLLCPGLPLESGPHSDGTEPESLSRPVRLHPGGEYPGSGSYRIPPTLQPHYRGYTHRPRSGESARKDPHRRSPEISDGFPYPGPRGIASAASEF